LFGTTRQEKATLQKKQPVGKSDFFQRALFFCKVAEDLNANCRLAPPQK
jgi:hypothetical protein